MFRDFCPKGLPSPYFNGIIKVDKSEFKRVAESIKYFDVIDERTGETWHCRALPFDNELGAN